MGRFRVAVEIEKQDNLSTNREERGAVETTLGTDSINQGGDSARNKQAQRETSFFTTAHVLRNFTNLQTCKCWQNVELRSSGACKTRSFERPILVGNSSCSLPSYVFNTHARRRCPNLIHHTQSSLPQKPTAIHRAFRSGKKVRKFG